MWLFFCIIKCTTYSVPEVERVFSGVISVFFEVLTKNNVGHSVVRSCLKLIVTLLITFKMYLATTGVFLGTQEVSLCVFHIYKYFLDNLRDFWRFQKSGWGTPTSGLAISESDQNGWDVLKQFKRH